MTLISKKRRPRIRLELLAHCYRLSLGEGFAGDLEEDFNYLQLNSGNRSASLWLWAQTFESFPTFIRIYFQWGWAMMVNYFRTFFRNIMRYRSTSMINLLGLSLGMAVFLVILLFTRSERQFDRFHKDYQKIYRLVSRHPASKDSYAGTPAPLGPALKEAFPEVEDYCRLKQRSYVVKTTHLSVRESRVCMADSNFFAFFTFPLIAGNVNTLLINPNSVVITESTAKKYFGDEPPVGKIMNFHELGDMIITAVCQDLPVTSHFHFDLVIPFVHEKNRYWGSWNYKTYMRFHHALSGDDLKNKVDSFFKGKDDLEQMLESVHYQPITDIHFQYNRSNWEPAVNGQFLHIFQAVAVLVLLLACLNYINLSTAYAQRRSKEVGIKKSVGVTRNQILRQFLNESMMMAVFAEIIALFLTMAMLPLLNQFAGHALDIPWHDPVLYCGAAALVVIVGILAGFYPAFILASIKPAVVLKGQTIVKKRSHLRAVLVVLQFTASIILVVCTLFINRQLHFINNVDLGYNREALINIRLNSALYERSSQIKNAMLGLTDVSEASLNSYTANSMNWNQSVYWEGQTEDQRTSMWLFSADTDFFETMDITLLEGAERVLNHHPGKDKAYYVLNEAAVREVGWEDAIGRMFDMNSGENMNGEVIGVVKDFHFRSLHHTVDPLAIYINKRGRWLSLRVNADNISQSLANIARSWQELAPGFEFEYEFLDDRIAKSYREEQNLGVLLNIFTALSLLIACMGLISLASFTVSQKTKEIGIRKVLGASTKGIAINLTQQFIKWVLLANLLAWPVALWGVRAWLNNFEYKITLDWEIFLLAGFGALAIAILSVSIQTVKAARTNPAENLSYE
ncbi:ABC transporter permease [bacterium]|nr:ABC transporter permease [bacterium]